jgi:tuberculosinol/isotuberculosinol synthase
LNLEAFRKMPPSEVAGLMRAAGPKVCVFPINGTRRWFLLEYPQARADDSGSAFLEVIAQQHLKLYRLLFDHGLDTLLTPAFGPDLLDRGDDYLQMAAEGLAWLATHPDFLEFYEAYGVRVRFYGDYARYFESTPYAHLAELFQEVTARTLGNDRSRLFFGLFAQDATETVAKLAVRHYIDRGTIPDKQRLVELYYGEYVAPVDFFIGFDKFCVFDMPLLATGNEDLYFTVSPSPYLNERQLRSILFDHLYARRGGEPDFGLMAPEDWTLMQDFYRINLDSTLGVGTKQGRGGIWYPLPQVDLPPGFEQSF